MKKFLMLWLPLIIIVLGGLGVGFWFLRDNGTKTTTETVEQTTSDSTTKSVAEVIPDIKSAKYLTDVLTSSGQIGVLQDGLNVIFFAPTQDSSDKFTADTKLDLPKVLPYHIVTSELAQEVVEGTKLKTKTGQEVIIVKKDGNLYVRDAKGHDYRLRKPVSAKNGKLYLIEGVLLPQ